MSYGGTLRFIGGEKMAQPSKLQETLIQTYSLKMKKEDVARINGRDEMPILINQMIDLVDRMSREYHRQKRLELEALGEPPGVVHRAPQRLFSR